jgi:hypothetical protein
VKDDLLVVYWVAEMVFSMVDRKDGKKVDVMVEWMAVQWEENLKVVVQELQSVALRALTSVLMSVAHLVALSVVL